jgi:hypothetical protein
MRVPYFSGIISPKQVFEKQLRCGRNHAQLIVPVAFPRLVIAFSVVLCGVIDAVTEFMVRMQRRLPC